MVKGKQMLDFQNVTGRFVNKTQLFIVLTSLRPGWQLSYTLSAMCEQAVTQLTLMLRYPQANLVPRAQSIGPEDERLE